MDEYRCLLILQYFLDKKENYNFYEIIEKLGIGYKKLFKMIEKLIDEKMLKYNNYLLEITDLGRQTILKNDIYRIYKGSIVNNSIDVSHKLSIYDVYIPKKFLKKV